MSGVRIIAEAGVNHNGDLSRAKALVDAASAAGASAVKFQTFKADLLATPAADKAAYQKLTAPGSESQLAMIRKLELSQPAFLELAEHCDRQGIEFMSTAFDSISLRFLHERIGIRCFKIASGELTNLPFLLEHAQLAEHLIVSTGMATLEEIRQALGVIAFGMNVQQHADARASLECFDAAYDEAGKTGFLKDKVTLLHCTTEYPAPIDQINLSAMSSIRQQFSLPVGYSDHTLGLTIPVAAVALGACVIEKHFTLDRTLPGPDHAMSLDPQQLASMVTAIKDTVSALGNGFKVPGSAERSNIDAVRKSLVASCAIRPGEAFTSDNLCMKRPGTGMPPAEYWNCLGRLSDRHYCKDEFIRP